MNPSAPAYTPPFRGARLTGGPATHQPTNASSQERDQPSLAEGQVTTGSRVDNDRPHNNNSITNNTQAEVAASTMGTLDRPSPSPTRTGHAAAVPATMTTTNAASISPSISPDKENEAPIATSAAPLGPSTVLRPSLARGALLRGGGSPIEGTAALSSTTAVVPTRTINAPNALVAAEMLVIDVAIAEGQGRAHSQPYSSSRQLAPQYYQHQQQHHHQHASSPSPSRSLSPSITSAGGGVETMTMGNNVYPHQYHLASCGGGGTYLPQQLNSAATASSYSGAYLPTSHAAAPHLHLPHPPHPHHPPHVVMHYHGGSMPLLSGSTSSSVARMSPPTSSMARQRSPLSTLYTAPSSSPSSTAASKSPSASPSPSVSVGSPTSVRHHRLPSPQNQEATVDEKNTCMVRPTPTTRNANVGVGVGAAPKPDSTPPPAQSNSKGPRGAARIGSGGNGQHHNKNSNINNISSATPTKTSAKTSNNNNGTGNTPNRFFFSSDVDAVPIPPPNTSVRVGVSALFSSTPLDSMSSSPLTSPTSAVLPPQRSTQNWSQNSSPAVGFPPAGGSGNRSSGSSPRSTPYSPVMNGSNNNVPSAVHAEDVPHRAGLSRSAHGANDRFSSLSPTSSGSTTRGNRAGTSPTATTANTKYTFNNNNTTTNSSTTRPTPARNTTHHADAHQISDHLVERQKRSASPRADSPSTSLLTPSRGREERGSAVGRSIGGEGGDVENLDAAALQRRQEQREKQISFGYNTEGYKNMLRLVEHDPRLKLGGVLPIEPPPPTFRSSKRTYDIYLRKWRRALHMFDYVFIDGSEDEHTTTREAVLEQQRLKWVSPIHHVHHTITAASGVVVTTLASVAPSPSDINDHVDNINNNDNPTARCVEGTPMRSNANHHNKGADAVMVGCTSTTPLREVDMVTPVKSASQPSMSTIITTGSRVFLSRELMLSKRLSPAVPRKIPVEDALRHYLRSPDCYEPLTTLIPQSALYNTKGTSFTAGDVGFKIVIAPSTVAGPYATARSPSPEVPDFAPSPPIALLNGGGGNSNSNNLNSNNNGSAFSSPTSAAARGRSSASGAVAAAAGSVSKSAANGGGSTVSSSDRSKNISKGTAAHQANEQDEGERCAHQPLFDALAATPSRQLTAAFIQSAGPSPCAAYTATNHLASSSARMGVIASAGIGTSAFLVPPPPLPPPLPASTTSTDMGAGARVGKGASVGGGSGMSLNANAVPFSFGSLSAHMSPAAAAAAQATQSPAFQHRPQLLRGAAAAPVSAVVVGGGGATPQQHVSRTSANSKPTPFRCQLSSMGSNGAQTGGNTHTLRTSASSSSSPSSSSKASPSPLQNNTTTNNNTYGAEGNPSTSPSPVIEIRVDEEYANNNNNSSGRSPPQSHAVVETTNATTNNVSRVLADNVAAANTNLHIDVIATCAKDVNVGGDNTKHCNKLQSAVPTSAASPSPRLFVLEGDERVGDNSASNSTILGDSEAPKCVGGGGGEKRGEEEEEEVSDNRCDDDTMVSSSATRRLMHEYMDE